MHQSVWNLQNLDYSMSIRYTFSGHETFPCRNLWLKKGYDFATEGNFNAPDAVVSLGVGKNMVSSIRYWLKVFGMTNDDQPTELARKLFADDGWDPYCEDELTLWLLHYWLVNTGDASLYKMVFLDYQRRNREFDKQQLQSFIETACKRDGYDVNSGTLSKDINVLLQNYVYPENVTDPEKCSNLLMNLRLIRYIGKEMRINERNAEIYGFADVNPEDVPEEVILYALLEYGRQEQTLSNDVLADVALTFSMSMPNLVKVLEHLAQSYPEVITYTDNSGIRNVHIADDADALRVLEEYYSR